MGWQEAVQGRCPEARIQQLLADLRGVVTWIQREGPPGPRFTWSHVVVPVTWLSLPPHRAALTSEWARLRLPLQALETLSENMQQLGLTTPPALSAWLTLLTTDNTRVRPWEYVPPATQELA